MCLLPHHLKAETHPVSETLCYLEYRMIQKCPKIPVIPNILHHHEKPLESEGNKGSIPRRTNFSPSSIHMGSRGPALLSNGYQGFFSQK
jgi:hypothetical protein